MNKNIIVISHRRSGTHLTIDTIRNNFPEYKKHKFVTLNEDIQKTDFQNVFFDSTKFPRVVKTHFLPDFNLYSDKSTELKQFFDNSFLIYIYRNGLDVMVSLYEYMKGYDENIQKMNFNDFLKTNNNFDKNDEKINRIKFWKYHIKQWKNSKYADRILWLKFEDFHNDYEKTIKKIAQKFNIEMSENTVDIRLTKSKIKNKKIKKLLNFIKGIKTTSVSARKGTSGDFKNYFDKNNLALFMSENEDLMSELDYKIDKMN